MSKILSRPYKVMGKIQHYDWGTKNEEAFIPEFLGIESEKDIPYAEYWIGIHPKAPSDVIVENKRVSLIELLENQSEDILGKRISEKFNNSLPFLLKVLSINKALSIQAHPNKDLAVALHKADPKNYPDDNHKPEIAIAIDKLKAIVGIKTIVGIRESIHEYPELKELICNESLDRLTHTKISLSEELIKNIYSEVMHTSEDMLKKVIGLIIRRFEKQNSLKEAEEQFLWQFDNYGFDVGLISLLLFNFINLSSGEAIFTPAGIPHAYISGNIVECMANSDNVVRSGLTPKFKDIDTLTKMLEVDSSRSVVDKYESENKIVYKTFAEEFVVESLKFDIPFKVAENNDICIILILNGNIEVNWNNSASEKYSKGDAILIPAVLKEYSIIGSKNSLVFRIRVPH